MAKIKTFESACKALGLNPDKVITEIMYKILTPDEIAYRKLKIITDALNGDWKLDWADDNQPKYYHWWDIIKNPKGASGFGLSLLVVNCVYSGTYLGVRLYYKDAATARYAYEQPQIRKLYEELILTER